METGQQQAPRENGVALNLKEITPMLTTYEFLATYLRARFEDERGASLVEYALLVALIAVVCIAAVTLLGKNASTKFSSVGSSIGG
jgi:pilus assembly protein Flp/PilA